MKNSNRTRLAGWGFWTALLLLLTGCDGWGGYTTAQTQMSSPAVPPQDSRRTDDESFSLQPIIAEVTAYIRSVPPKEAVACFYGLVPKWMRPLVFLNLPTDAQRELKNMGFRLVVQKRPDLQAGLTLLENRSTDYLLSVQSQRNQVQAVARQGQEFLNSMTPAEKRLWDAYVNYFFEPNGGVSPNYLAYKTLRLTQTGVKSLAPLAKISNAVRNAVQNMDRAPQGPGAQNGSQEPLFVVSSKEMPVVYRTIDVRRQDLPRVLKELEQSPPPKIGEQSPSDGTSGASHHPSLAWPVPPIWTFPSCNCYSEANCPIVSFDESSLPPGTHFHVTRHCDRNVLCDYLHNCLQTWVETLCPGTCITVCTLIQIIDE